MAYPKTVNLIVKTLEDKKAKDINVYKTNNSLCDYTIVCTSLNERNANALVENLVEEFEKNNIDYKHIEGRESSKWIVIDCYDYIIHIFNDNSRNYYNIDEILK